MTDDELYESILIEIERKQTVGIPLNQAERNLVLTAEVMPKAPAFRSRILRALYYPIDFLLVAIFAVVWLPILGVFCWSERWRAMRRGNA